MARISMSTSPRSAGSIGAVVGGIRIGGDVSPAAVAELRAALLRHRVVFLRDQQHATDADQRRSPGCSGALTKPHPTVAGRRRCRAAHRLRAGQGQQLAHRRDVRGPGPGDQRAARHHAAALRRDHRLGEHRGGVPAAAPGAAGPGRRPARGAQQPVRLRRRAPADRRHRRQGKGVPARSSATWSSRPSTRSSASTRRPASRPCCSATSSGRSPGCSSADFQRPVRACCSGTSPGWRTPSAGPGGTATSRSGTTGPPSTTRSPTTTTCRGCCTGSRSPATSRSASAATPASSARATPATTPTSRPDLTGLSRGGLARPA